MFLVYEHISKPYNINNSKILYKNMFLAMPRFVVYIVLWYNNSANAESKAADAALTRWREDYTGNPWIENQMPTLQSLDFLRSWYNVREHNEPSGCEADIWRMCTNHDEAKHNHGII